MTQPEKCEICDGNNCNNRTLYRASFKSCVKCNDDTECAFGQDSGKTENCTMGVYFGRIESCFVRSFDNGTVQRGCTVDVDQYKWNWCTDTDNCTECFTDGCNSFNVKYHSCGQCKGDKDGECAKLSNPGDFIKKCDNTEHYPYSKHGCYTIEQGMWFVLLLSIGLLSPTEIY